MAFFGKEYKLVSHENYEAFLKATGVPDDQIASFLESKPTAKLEKNGNTYTYTSTSASGPRVVTFQEGVEVDEMLEGKVPVKTTYSVSGNVVTQVVHTDKGTATFKREFGDNELVVTMTATTFPGGVAKRIYKA